MNNIDKATVDAVNQVDCDTDVLKCPNCGSTMLYEPASGNLKCLHCGSESAVEKKPTGEIVYSDADDIFGEKEWTDEVISYRCSSCGAVSVMSKYEVAEKCPFCGVTNITQVDDLKTYIPNAILPFKISLQKASAAFTQWIRKRFFAPKKFKKSFTPENVRGAYLPSWTFDTNTVAQYSGVLGKTETKTVGSGKNRRTVTTVKWFKVSGYMNRDYDDLIIEASKSIDQKELTKILPFDTKLSVGYDKAYLSGFSGERYDKDVHTALQDAKKIIYKEYEEAIKDRYNADKVKTLDINIQYANLTYRYLLLPLWIDNYEYNNKKFRILVNGRSAKVGGKYPLSPWKVGMVVLLGIALVALVIYLRNS